VEDPNSSTSPVTINNNSANTYSQIYLENEMAVSQTGRPIFDQASDEITKHFNNTLQEINSILNREEQNKQNSQVKMDQDLAQTGHTERSVLDELMCENEKKGLQKTSKIEETIRKNNERNQKMRSENSENWKKRQVPLPPTQPAPAAPLESVLSREELNFFVSAIEKMKFTSFFKVGLFYGFGFWEYLNKNCFSMIYNNFNRRFLLDVIKINIFNSKEENLKKLSDRQVYEALLDHARTQNIKLPPVFTKVTSSVSNNISVSKPHQNLESIDKFLEEEDDLPIIIRNLHSVKSLKHFFEVRNKSILAEHQPSDTEKEPRLDEYLACKKPEVSTRQISITNYEPSIPVSKNPVPMKREQDIIKANRQQGHPVAPPLPEFLKKLSSLHSHKHHMIALVEPKKEQSKQLRVSQKSFTRQDSVASRSELKTNQNSNNHGDSLMMHHHFYQHQLGKNLGLKSRTNTLKK